MAWLTSRVWPVVPVKRLSAAKQRLRGALGSRGDEFARLLARRTIETLARSRTVAGILVVTSDPVVVEDAHAAGALVVDDAAHSLNAAYALGIAAAGGFGADLCALVPADLALLSAAGFDAIVFGYDDHRQRAGRSAVGLVRCKDGTGTNMALFDPHSDFVPEFGPDSFARHMHTAGTDGHELPSDEAAFDIDTVEDLRNFARQMGAAGSDDWLRLIAAASATA